METLLVFVNVKVASLSKHKHLFGGHGCYSTRHNHNGGIPCDGKDILPEEYRPLLDCRRDNVGEVVSNYLRMQPWNCTRTNRTVVH